jgi:putative colanic acid biosynthesis UDP-glucose lipid carrier transferase
LKISASFSRGAMLLFAAFVPLLLTANRIYWKRYISRAMSAGTFAARRIGVITDGSYFARQQLARRLRDSGFEIVRHVDLSLPSSNGERFSLRRAVQHAALEFRGANIDEIVIAMSWRRFPLASRIVEGLRALPLPVRLVMDPQTTEMATQRTRRIGGLLAVELQRGRMTATEHVIKRAIDVTLAGIALFALSPLLLIVALAIKLDTPGPVLFRQTRHGFNNLPFRILKFRSMSVMEDGAVVQQARRVDARVTRVGKWIRRTSVDELPQLWNVIQGEMSLVGPRPHAAAHDGYYEALLGDYAFRQHVKPGITGWAQVNGSRGETATIESMARRVQLDVWYVKHRSAWLDIKIMFLTAAQLFKNRQVY